MRCKQKDSWSKCWDTYIEKNFIFLSLLENIKNGLYVRLLQNEVTRIYKGNRTRIKTGEHPDVTKQSSKPSPTSSVEEVVCSIFGLFLLIVRARKRRRRQLSFHLRQQLLPQGVDVCTHLLLCWVHLVQESVNLPGEKTELWLAL